MNEVNISSDYCYFIRLVKSNKHCTLKKGVLVGKIDKIMSVNSLRTSLLNTGTDNDTSSCDDKDINNIPPQYREKIDALIKKNKDLFAKSDHELGKTDIIQMKIDTGDHPPINLKPYRTPMHKKHIVDKAIDDMLDAKIIEPSHSEWAFPIVIVDKKDGSKRFCVIGN